MNVSPWLRHHTSVRLTLTEALADIVRLSPRTVYLCGGINGLGDAACKDWRALARDELGRHQIDVLDPMARDYRGREDECVAEIVDGDKRDIMLCPAILVNASRPSWGTAMEIMFAWVLRYRLARWLFRVVLRSRCSGPKTIVSFMEAP